MDNEKQELIRVKNQEICNLTADLSAAVSSVGDWKIIKIYEARLSGKEDPYDYTVLAAKRQAIRDRINQLQQEIAELEAEEDGE